MNKKIKMTELLTMIANKENVPKIIKVNGCIYNWVGSGEYYENEGTGPATLVQNYLTCAHNLRSNVEILEDEEEIDIQELEDVNLFDNGQNFNDMPIIIKSYDDNFTNINNTINKLIQAVKRLDKKNK